MQLGGIKVSRGKVESGALPLLRPGLILVVGNSIVCLFLKQLGFELWIGLTRPGMPVIPVCLNTPQGNLHVLCTCKVKWR